MYLQASQTQAAAGLVALRKKSKARKIMSQVTTIKAFAHQQKCKANLVEDASIAICSYTLLDSDFYWEDIAILMGTNDLPWASPQ